MTDSSTELEPTTPTPPTTHRVRITSDGKLSGSSVEIDGRPVGQHVSAVEWRLEANKQLATARVTFVGVEIDGIAEGTATIGDHPTGGSQEQPATGDVARQLAAIGQQLQALIIQASIACATCLAEERQAARQGHNIVNAIVDGTGYCNDHLDVVNGRLVPRKTSGLIVAGG